jgi:uncharacterized protein
MKLQEPRLAVLAAIASAAIAGGEALAARGLVDAARVGDRSAALALLAEGASADEAAPDGTHALHWAVYNGDAELVERLIAAGAEVTAVNDYGATPMSEAAVRGDLDILSALLDAGADPDSPNADGQTALMVVARTSNVDAARLLVERGADVDAVEARKGQTALMWAAAQARPSMVRLLIEHGADIAARSAEYPWQRRVTAEPRTKDITPGGFTPLLFAARQGCVDCARALVEAGADVDETNPDTVSPLLMALLNAQFDTAAYLIEAGADVNQWDWWGRTPLYAAVDYNTLPHGGRPDRPSLSETSALEIIERLIDAGANPNAQLKLFPPYRSLRADRGADSILGIGATPLLRAARAGDTEAIALLLDRGALVDLPQADGITPLMAAAKLDGRSIDTRGKFTSETQLIAGARLLLDAGADVDAADHQGRTALHAAASQGMTEMARLLVAHGADLDAVDVDGATVVDAALGRWGFGPRGGGEAHEDTAALLEELRAAAR